MIKRILIIMLVGLMVTVPLVVKAPKVADAVGALVLSNPTPADGAVVSVATGQIKVRFQDDPAVKVMQPDVVLKVDGRIVYHTMAYDWKTIWDPDEGTETNVDDYSRGWIIGPTMESGTHDVSVTVTDIVGNTATLNWSYSMDAFEITTVPENGKRVGSLNPTITINAENLYAQDTDNVTATMKVNGTTRPVTLNRVDTKHWTVTSTVYNLANEVAVNVTGTISNNRGISRAYSFKFTPSTTKPHLFIYNALDGRVYTSLTNLNERVVKVGWDDPDGIDESSLVMTVDQKTVPASINGSVITGPTLTNGTHVVNVKVKDKLGNEASLAYTLTFKVPPMLEVSPRQFTTLQPLLSFPLDVMGSGLDTAKTTLFVDGKQYPVIISGGTVTSQMPKMVNESIHNAVLTAVDSEGLTSTLNLKISVNTFGDMPYNNNGCTGCHDTRYYSSQNKWAHTKSPDGIALALQAGSPDAVNCEHCHALEDAVTGGNYCYYCHDVVDATNPHNGGYPGGTSPMPPTPALKKPGTDCINCHAPLTRVPENWWPGAFTMPLGMDYPYDPAEKTQYPYKHLIYSSHNTVYDAVYEQNCQGCHGSNITRTHNNKKSKITGQTLDCGSCHMSKDTKVKTAIVNGQTACSACHDTKQGHDSLHVSTLDNKCTTCHKDTLTQDHITRTDKNGDNYTCDTCHADTDFKVVRTIAENSKDCEGCHATAHNIPLVDKVPKDIPLMEGLLWTTPIEAGIFTGDKGVPTGYTKGQVLVSSRKSMTSAEVWSFYNTQLTANGWRIKSGAPTADVNYFAAEFTLGDRYVTVKYIKTVSNDGLGPSSTLGARIQLWYK